jgi:hypothetical protein
LRLRHRFTQVFLAAGSDVGGDYSQKPPALYFDGMKVRAV